MTKKKTMENKYVDIYNHNSSLKKKSTKLYLIEEPPCLPEKIVPERLTLRYTLIKFKF